MQLSVPEKNNHLDRTYTRYAGVDMGLLEEKRLSEIRMHHIISMRAVYIDRDTNNLSISFTFNLNKDVI